MIKSKTNSAAFGSSVKRFGKNTLHPNLDINGLYVKRPNGCDPCLYHPLPTYKFCDNSENKSNTKDPWRYKKELEEWARNLGYRNQKILKQRKWFDSLLGPAWHDFREPPKYKIITKDVGFGTSSRFRILKNNTPGPGSYYKADIAKCEFSLRPTFEREESCRFKDKVPKWSLAPNRYTILDKESMENIYKKVVSLRGPYDLFTGKRDGSTIKNHFNTSLKCSAATWPIALEGSFEKYKKSHFGSMNKTNRDLSYRGRNALVDLSMSRRRPQDPGPTHYSIKITKTFKENKHGFNSTYDKPPGYRRVVVWPGVGRYTINDKMYDIPGFGHRHVFLSKQQRTMGAVLPEPMNSF